MQTDYIDLYLSHRPDAKAPVEETLGAYEALLRRGKVKAVGASNHSPQQLRQALDVASRSGLPHYQMLQPEYNLYNRNSFEGGLRDLCMAEGLGVITYYGLASGFLTGKYRNKNDLVKSARGAGIDKYLNPRGLRILDALDAVEVRVRIGTNWFNQKQTSASHDDIDYPTSHAHCFLPTGSDAPACLT